MFLIMIKRGGKIYQYTYWYDNLSFDIYFQSSKASWTIAKKNLGVLKIHLLLDGLVLYQTNEDVKKIQKLRFLNNTFLVLKTFEKLSSREKAFGYML